MHERCDARGVLVPMSFLNGIGTLARRRFITVRRDFSKIRRKLSTFTGARVELEPSLFGNHRKSNGAVSPQKSPPALSPPVSSPPVSSPPAISPPALSPPATSPPAKRWPATLANGWFGNAQPAVALPPPQAVPDPNRGLALREELAAKELAAKNEKQYAEQKTYREAMLRATKLLNRMVLAAIIVGALSLIGLYYAIQLASVAVANAQKTAQASAGTTKIDQRAWVGPGTVALQLPYNRSNIGMTVLLNNTGKTPAQIDGIDVNVATVKSRVNQRGSLFSEHLGPRTLAPNSQLSLSISEPRPISQADFRALLAKHARHEFSIAVQYRDIFGDSHQTQICNVVEGTQRDMTAGNPFAPCSPNAMN